MKNILSYQFFTPFTGKEIREWALFQIEHHTSHSKEADWLLKRKIVDTRLYYFSRDVYPLYKQDRRLKMPYFRRFPQSLLPKRETN